MCGTLLPDWLRERARNDYPLIARAAITFIEFETNDTH